MLSQEMVDFVERHSGRSFAEVVALSPFEGQKGLIEEYGCGARIDDSESRVVVDRGSILQGLHRFGYSDEFDGRLAKLS